MFEEVDSRGHMFEGYREANASKVSLQERLQDMTGKPFSLEETRTILGKIGQALCYAHECNVTHGNLKPDTILFDENGNVLLAEFFLHALAAQSDNGKVTEDSVYRAPELLPGQASKQGDQYALGCIAYEMLTGNKPLLIASISKPDTFYRTKKPIPPTSFNQTLSSLSEEAILKAIAKEPAERHRDISCFLTALGISTDIGDQATSMEVAPISLALDQSEQADLFQAAVWYAVEEAETPPLSIAIPGQMLRPTQASVPTGTAEFSSDYYPVAYNLLVNTAATNAEANMPTDAYTGLLSKNSDKWFSRWRWIGLAIICLVVGCIVATSFFALFALRSTQEHKTISAINTKIDLLSPTSASTPAPLTPTPEVAPTPKQKLTIAPTPTATVQPIPTPTPRHRHH